MDVPLTIPDVISVSSDDPQGLLDALRRREAQRKSAFKLLIVGLVIDLCVLLVMWLTGYKFHFWEWVHQLFSVFSLTSAAAVFWAAVIRLCGLWVCAYRFRQDHIIFVRRYFVFCEFIICMAIVLTDASGWPRDDSVQIYFVQMLFVAVEFGLISYLLHRVKQVDTCHERISPNDNGETVLAEFTQNPEEAEVSGWEKFAILKPYFWPSTPPYMANRIRACLTWLFVGISKVLNSEI